jgi:hypothetical protein
MRATLINAEAVPDLLSRVGPRPGAFERIAAVGLDLPVRDHDEPSPEFFCGLDGA